MAHNRIRRFESIRSDESPASLPAPSPTNNPTASSAPIKIPEGFTAFPLAAFSPIEQQRIQLQRSLYQWAYEAARQKVDRELFGDWTI